jgi:hypothetical protein
LFCSPAGISNIISTWLDEEWTPLDVHQQLGEAAGAAYVTCRQQGDDDMSSLVLGLSNELLAFNYRETFVNAFEVRGGQKAGHPASRTDRQPDRQAGRQADRQTVCLSVCLSAAVPGGQPTANRQQGRQHRPASKRPYPAGGCCVDVPVDWELDLWLQSPCTGWSCAQAMLHSNS